MNYFPSDYDRGLDDGYALAKSEDSPYRDLKVYVVEKEHYQTSEVVAVFDTADKAQAYCEENNKTIDPYLKRVRLSGYEWNEWEVR